VRITNWMLRVATLAAAFALAGCTPQADLQQLNQNQFTLRGMIASDRQQIDALKAQVARQNDQIEELKHNSSEGAGEDPLNDKVAKLETEVSALQAGMAATPGVVVPPAGDSTGTTVGAVPPTGPAATGPAAPAMPAETTPTWPAELDQEITDANGSSEPGIKMYRQGLDAMKAGKYPLAVANFTRLQHSYPKSPLSEPAEYFAANALYETGEFDKAILQFNDLVMRFPKGKYAAAALLREAQAFLKLNDRIDARLTLQKLISDHAGTPEEIIANSMMKDLTSD
jgi:tol-pal system protein YbgF